MSDGARFTLRRWPPWIVPFAFASAWTAFEFVVSLVSPHGSALSVAYSQVDVLPLLQVSSVVGLWGITFVLLLVPSAVATAWARRAPSVLLAPVVIALVVFGYGGYRLRQPTGDRVVRVGMAVSDRGHEQAFATEQPSVALGVAQSYSARVARLAARGAQVIILPEKLVGVTPAVTPEILRVFSETARSARATVVIGLNELSLPSPRNVALVFSPDGRLAAEYEKHHLLPGPETGYVVGKQIGLFTASRASWGVAICKDMDFPSWSRRYGRSDVRLLAVPAWDFVRDARLHSRMALVRAVENGFAMARAAEEGNLTVSDAYGRVLAEESSVGRSEALLVANIAIGPGETLYARTGDWFGWLSIGAIVAIVAMGVLLPPQGQSSSPTTSV